jgi:DNA-binding response OmpR family regulator
MSESAPTQPAPAPVILVVDDDPAIVELQQDLLTSAGYAVEHVSDGLAGLARLQAGGVDLVLLDLLLPGLSGIDLCRAVRAAAQADTVYVPIIMVTALSSATEQRAGFLAGADDYVTKPFDVQELRARVAVWLRVRRHAQAAHATREALRAAERRQAQVQVEAIHLAAREVAHRLNNDLTLAVGFLELLQHSSSQMTAAEHTLLADARRGLAAAVGTVEQLQQVVQVVTKDTPSGLALDLERSTRLGADER